ncbi:MAG: HEAT repeat domain-containing protein [Candidatus Kryptoniota bacterium]
MNLVIVSLAIVALVATVVFLSAFLFLRKVMGLGKFRASNKLKDYYSAEFLQIIFSDTEPDYRSIVENFKALIKDRIPFGAYGRKRHYAVAQEVLLSLAQEIKGEELERVRRLYKELGFVKNSIRKLRDQRWWKRAEAVRELEVMKCESALDFLFPLLSDQNEEVRALAFEAGIEIGGTDVLPILIEAIPKISLWLALNLSGIIKSKKEDAGSLLMPLLKVRETTVRKFTIQMLGMLEWIPATDILIQIANGNDLQEAAYALMALASIGDQRAFPVGMKAILNPHWQIRACAAQLLGRLGDERAVPILLDRLSDESYSVRLNSAWALANCGQFGIAALSHVVSSKIGRAVEVAAEVLDEIKLGNSGPEVAFQW